jgi:hypothetical protein
MSRERMVMVEIDTDEIVGYLEAETQLIPEIPPDIKLVPVDQATMLSQPNVVYDSDNNKITVATSQSRINDYYREILVSQKNGEKHE